MKNQLIKLSKQKLLVSTLCMLTSSQQLYSCDRSDSEMLLKHIETGGVGYDKGYTSLSYLFTHEKEPSELLIDVRAHLFNDKKLAGNAGIGYRHETYVDHHLGVNLFYDVRQIDRLWSQQLGTGLEWLSRNVDVRLNGYLPLKGFNFKLLNIKTLSKHRSFNPNGYQLKALPLLEGEIGTSLFKPLYGAFGIYGFFNAYKDHFNSRRVMGLKARIEIDLGPYLKVGSSISRDPVFKTRLQGMVSLNIPLGREKREEKRGLSQSPCLCKCEREGVRDFRHVPVVRNEIISFSPAPHKIGLFRQPTFQEVIDQDLKYAADLKVLEDVLKAYGAKSVERSADPIRQEVEVPQPMDSLYRSNDLYTLENQVPPYRAIELPKPFKRFFNL